MTRQRTMAIATTALLAVSLTACGDDDGTTSSTTKSTTAVSSPAVTTASTGGPATGQTTDGSAVAGTVAVERAWARTSPAMATAGAAYMVLTAAADDELLGAKVDASVAGKVELHETKAAATDGTAPAASGMGAMTMVPVESISLPKGTAVALEPGGFHVMLLGLVTPLEAGSTLSLTLVFKNAGEQVVDIPVRDDAP